MQQCDILIAGAGPAGSSAALASALEGLQVVVAERKAVVGKPVHCAEFIPAPLMGEIPARGSFIVQPIRGMKTVLPQGEVIITQAPGFTIHRDLFDQTLAHAAKEAGARFLLSTKVVRTENGTVMLEQKGRGVLKVRPKVIIGADGPRSTVAGWMGGRNKNLLAAVQVRVSLLRPLEFTEVYFDKAFYGGYGWLFPKGREANLGLGIRKRPGRAPQLRSLLEQFMARLAGEEKIKSGRSRILTGWIPAAPVENMVCGNMALVGDAAGHTHPLTGAGIPQAVLGGRMAGKWAARSVKEHDMGLLGGYVGEWEDLFGSSLRRAIVRRRMLENGWEHLEKIIRQCWVVFREYHGPIRGEAETC